MALTNLSQVTSSGIHTLSNYTTHNINSTGIITATSFSGNLSSASGISTFAEIRVTGNLTVEGTTTTLDSNLTEVDRIEVGANTAAVGLALTQSGSGAAATFEGGSVGIGTNAPQAPLHLFGSSDILLEVESTDRYSHIDLTDNSSTARITNDGGTGTLRLRADKDNAVNNSNIQFEIDGSEKVRITSAGNVGIGTLNPTAKLQVVSYGDHGKIRVESSGDSNRAGIEFFRESSAGTGKGAAGIWVESETGNSTGELRFGTASNAGLQSLSTKMILDSSGDLGIGTDNPSRILHVSSSNDQYIRVTSTNSANAGIEFGDTADKGRANIVYANSDDSMFFTVNGSEKVRIKSNGYVGIGSADPTRELQVAAEVPQVSLISTNSTLTEFLFGDLADDNIGRLRYDHSDDSLELWTNANERLHINSAGKVGIGTDNPTSHLQVYRKTQFTNNPIIQARSDNGSINELKFEIDGDGDAYFNGNVGIGVTTPDVYSLGGNNRYAAIKASAGYTVLNLVDSNNSGSYLQFGNPTVRRGSLHFDSSSNFIVTINESGSGTNLTEKLRLDLYGRLTISGQGLKLNPNNSNLYTLDGSLSYYATNNAVYLNGAGTGGWLRLNAAGTENNHNAINIFGGGAGAYISMRTSNVERLRITSGGQINIDAPSESLGGKVLIKHNVDYTTTDFDDSPTLFLLNDDRTTGVSEAAIVFAGRNTSGSTFRAAISGNGSTGLKFYTTSNTESDDTPAMLINGSDKVGIRTDNPKQVFSVVGRANFDHNGDYYGAWIDGNSNGTSSFNVGSWYNTGGKFRNDGNNVVIETMNENHDISIQPGANEGKSRVGVGIHGPSVKLHVRDTANAAGVTATDILRIANLRVNTGAGAANLRFVTNEVSGTNQYTRAQIGAEYDGSSNTNGRLMFATSDTSGNLNEWARLNSVGKLLVVKGTYGFSNAYSKSAVNSHLEAGDFRISDPQDGFALTCGSYGRSNTSGAYAGLGLAMEYPKIGLFAISEGSSYGQGDFAICINGTSDSSVATLSDEKFRIKKNGNIGINKNSPTQRLHMSGAIRQDGYGNNVQYHQACYAFGSGATHTLYTLSGNGNDATAIAVFEYVCLYAYAGTNHEAGIIYASTRRTNSNTAWGDIDNIAADQAGNDSSIRPNLFWQNGVLKITVGSSVQCTGTLRLTTRRFTVTRNYSAG